MISNRMPDSSYSDSITSKYLCGMSYTGQSKSSQGTVWMAWIEAYVCGMSETKSSHGTLGWDGQPGLRHYVGGTS